MSDTPNITIYTAIPCGYCTAAKQFFSARGLAYKEIDLTSDPAERMALMKRTGQRTVPQSYINETHVGGYSDLRALSAAGGLESLLGKV